MRMSVARTALMVTVASAAVWAQVNVGDAVLKVAIREIRSALDDDSDAPRFVQTARRVGYRFVAPVSLLPAVPYAETEMTAAPVPHDTVEPDRAPPALRLPAPCAVRETRSAPAVPFC